MLPVNLSSIAANVAGTYTAQSVQAQTGSVGGALTSQFTSQLSSAAEGTAPIPLTGSGVSNLQPVGNTAAASSFQAQTIGEPTSWGQMVHQMVQDVNQAQQTAGAKVRDVLAGGPTPVHEALIATEEASVSFQVLAEVRNKVIDAYQEVMRMSV
jgi:flagellar hook-basal body complex protein FliE